ncbi:LysR family transcriptional regulator [Nordella sp. HKS 07]|uniref:LysR family transcriptional regulator n=1 Tax=Nordella sp. HKS 07 TaxID=2712222 RepID=UPI0013E1324E|nr:LysR family transcriptional regulator [Nordella sp. HKS 07]QIG48038.1 LysR family transcriptional regulator [Nordella sp. HKS 07]
MDIRQLSYLSALAREKHFTRAAQACNISQPTLSGRIRQLEQELGVPIVERGQRYHGLTPEGERVLKWAHTILDNWQAMQQELASIKGRKEQLTGRLMIGAVPSALPMAPLLTQTMQAQHPGVDFTVLSHSTAEILRGLNDFSLDVGIAYLDNEPIDGLTASPLYRERYCLFVASAHPLASRESVSWFEAAQEPLCLLTPNMQNRRIIDRAFRSANCQPQPRLETNSVINLWSNVRFACLASIMPEYFLDALGPATGVSAVPLADPHVEHAVGLLVVDREPLAPIIAALQQVALGFDPAALRKPPPLHRE